MSPAQITRLAHRHIARASVFAAALLVYLLPLSQPRGVPHVPWWTLLPASALLSREGYSRQQGSNDTLNKDSTGLLTPMLLLLLAPWEALCLHMVVSVTLRTMGASKLKRAFNATSILVGLALPLAVFDLVLDGHDALSPRGALGLCLAEAAGTAWDFVHMQRFLTRISGGGRIRWRSGVDWLGDGLLFSMFTCVIWVALLFVTVRVSRAYLVAFPLVCWSLFLAQRRSGALLQQQAEAGAHNDWLKLVRDDVAVDDLDRLAVALRASLRAQGVRISTGFGTGETGQLPAPPVIADGCHRVLTNGEAEFGWRIGRKPHRRRQAMSTVRLRDGQDSWLVLSYDTASSNRLPATDPEQVRLAAGEIERAVDRRRAQLRIERAATHDGLTDLRRATTFVSDLNGLLADWPSATVLLIDIGRLREVNDLFGRDAGDELLRSLAQRLATALPEKAITGRLGGHLLAAAVPGDDEERAHGIALLLLRVLRTRPDGELPRAEVGLTIGTAYSPEHGTDAATLLRRAELGLDAARDAGLATATFSWEAEAVAQRRLRLVPDLRAALADGAITAFYQPQVSPVDGSVLGMEALARWTHPELGFIPPDEFVALAESSGLVMDLTVAMLRQSLQECRSLAGEGLVVPVSVNLSARSLTDPTLLPLVRDLLVETGVPAHRLTLEVTETAMLDNASQAIAALNELRALGCKVSLDDFGTGQSSLAYLRSLPADEVKLDRAFTSDLADTRAVALVRASVQLAHTLGLIIVAEGVEDEASLLALRDLGVDVAQGYHVCRPGPPTVTRDFLRARALPVLAA